jgi:hypothetical protein
MVRQSLICLVFLTATATASPAAAQWIKHPTPGVPRTADGKPDLAASAPRAADGKPDLTGMWRLEVKPGTDPIKAFRAGEFQPWARARQEKYEYELGRDDPAVHCLPFGPRASLTYGFAGKFIQTPAVLVVLFEDLTYRQIFLDGRQLPPDPNPTWMGYSVGRWESDTLVVDSIGYNDRSLLDFEGHPHTEALRITERFRRRDFGHMDVEVAVEDPKTLAKRVGVSMEAVFVPDTELLEYVCQENERSRQRMIGTADDDKKLAVAVAPEVLARYAGAYRVEMPEGPARILTVYVQDGQLLMDIERGITGMKTIPVSQTRFMTQGVAVEFFPRPDGSVSELVVTIVEGNLKGVRLE